MTKVHMRGEGGRPACGVHKRWSSSTITTNTGWEKITCERCRTTDAAFDQWKRELADELQKVFGLDIGEGAKYIERCGDECWREAFGDGLSPADTASEEVLAEAEGVDVNREAFTDFNAVR